MAAQIEIDESNGVGEIVSHNIANANMGVIDAHELNPISNPIPPGGRSMVKYHRIHVVAMNGSSKIDDIRIWQTGALAGAAAHMTNLRTSSYGGAIPYVQPVTDSVINVDQAIPIALPNTANLGIGGSLGGSLVAPGWSDYFAHQIITGQNDPSGASATLNIQYGEVL